MFELTYRCNFNCRHCYVPKSYREESERKDLKTKEIYYILDQLSQAGCLYLGFTGGEPFVREDILDILRYANARGFLILIYTNGSLINEKIADELKKLGPNKVDITINSLKKERFERITGAIGLYGSVFRAIDLLRQRNIPLGFKSCALQDNQHEIKEIRRFAQAYQANYRLEDMLMPTLNGSKEPYRFMPPIKGFGFQVPEVRDKPQAVHRTPTTTCLFPCGVGLYNFVITPFGELKMCIHINYPRYSIFETSLGECWQRLKALVDNIKTDKNYECDECQLRPFCRWCPARAWLEDGSFTSCVTESKRRAEYNRRTAQEKRLEIESEKERSEDEVKIPLNR
jgi:radical SAM protein with 4Fe4S-binding SPASM domain